MVPGNFKNSLYILQIVNKILRKVKDKAFLQELAYIYLTYIAEYLKQAKQSMSDGKPSIFQINGFFNSLFISLSKNLRDLIFRLNKANSPIDFTKHTEQIDLIFGFVKICEDDQFSLMKEVECISLDNVVYNIAFNISLRSKYEENSIKVKILLKFFLGKIP
jgi:hypothetical protein